MISMVTTVSWPPPHSRNTFNLNARCVYIQRQRQYETAEWGYTNLKWFNHFFHILQKIYQDISILSLSFLITLLSKFPNHFLSCIFAFKVKTSSTVLHSHFEQLPITCCMYTCVQICQHVDGDLEAVECTLLYHLTSVSATERWRNHRHLD